MAPSGGLRLTSGAATYLVNHVVLPPQLPHEDDSDPSHEQCLLDVVIYALQDLRDYAEDSKAKEDITTAIRTISRLDYSRDRNGDVSEPEVRKLLETIATATIDEVVPLEIKAHNAGLIITRSAKSIVFEAFELSPTNKSAMSAVGRLVRTFPGCASSMPKHIIDDPAFRTSLAFTLAKMSAQAAAGSQPQIRKTGKLIDEDRDTTDPAMVTDWFMNYIAALGGMSDASRISKNTREEVLWRDCLQPWRRSPLWLLVRVNLQLLFARRAHSEQTAGVLYKAFVIQLLSHLLSSVRPPFSHYYVRANHRSTGQRTLLGAGW
jgi:hypothetical protein